MVLYFSLSWCFDAIRLSVFAAPHEVEQAYKKRQHPPLLFGRGSCNSNPERQGFSLQLTNINKSSCVVHQFSFIKQKLMQNRLYI